MLQSNRSNWNVRCFTSLNDLLFKFSTVCFSIKIRLVNKSYNSDTFLVNIKCIWFYYVNFGTVLFYDFNAKNNLPVQKKMMTPLLIDALTISEGRFEKPCPALVLKMMLLNEKISSEFSEKIKNQALLLLAIYRKLLLAIDRDLCKVKILKDSVKRRHWGKNG